MSATGHREPAAHGAQPVVPRRDRGCQGARGPPERV